MREISTFAIALLAAATAGILAGVGCDFQFTQTSQAACTGDDCETDASTDGNMACTEGGDECAANADQPYCDLSSGMCVACVVGQADHCPDRAVGTECLAATNTCGCIVGDHCPDSMVCGLDGRCEDASNIVYVAQTGGVEENCGLSNQPPCSSIMAGVDLAMNTDRITTVRIADGSYAETVTVEIMQSLRIVGESPLGTSFTSADGTNMNAIEVSGSGTEVTIEGLTLRAAVVRNAIECPSGTLNLRRISIENASGIAVNA
ncbi:MAG: hypothetical protein AAGC55_22170, partial [Myxococcota bacterium]